MLKEALGPSSGLHPGPFDAPAASRFSLLSSCWCRSRPPKASAILSELAHMSAPRVRGDGIAADGRTAHSSPLATEWQSTSSSYDDNRRALQLTRWARRATACSFDACRGPASLIGPLNLPIPTHKVLGRRGGFSRRRESKRAASSWQAARGQSLRGIPADGLVPLTSDHARVPRVRPVHHAMPCAVVIDPWPVPRKSAGS